jgi:hypothetical protein
MSSGKYQVFPTTGGVSVEVTVESVAIEQADILGDEADRVEIPREMFHSVLSAIFDDLDLDELREIAQAAEIAARARQPGGK